MKFLERAKSEFRQVLLALALFSLVINLLMLTMPLYMLQIYDRVLPSRSTDTLTFLTIIAVTALVVFGLLEGVRNLIAARAALRLDTTLGAETLSAVIRQGKATQGDIQPLRDLAAIRTFISSRVVFALLDLPFSPIFIAILYFIHPHLFWITLTGAVVLALVALVSQRTNAAAMSQSANSHNEALGAAQAFARNSESLQAMGMVEDGISIWGRANAAALIAQDAAAKRSAFLTGLSKTLRICLQVAVLGYGAYLVLEGQMTAGMIFASSIISGRGLQPIDQVIGGWRQYVVAWSAWLRLNSVLATNNKPAAQIKMPDVKGQVSVEGLVVAAPGSSIDSAMLKRVSFSLQQGESLGIVGPSGAGKSTLARVLVGAVVPLAGQVRLDGVEILQWDSEDLGHQIGYLSQEVELLPGTVANNIARLSRDADSEKILAAAHKAGVHEMILRLPAGYDTVLGLGGFALSGGQRQRIALARAFYGDPKLVILDEPNANLDEAGDAALSRALKAASENKATVMLVTQRLQILKSVDMILRLHAGAVDFFGSKDEFVARLSAINEQAIQRQQSKTSGNEKKRSESSPPPLQIEPETGAATSQQDKSANSTAEAPDEPKFEAIK